MNSLITGQIQTVIENLYLVETSFCGAPSLESDIQRVRQSINLVKGVDLVIKQPTGRFPAGERSTTLDTNIHQTREAVAVLETIADMPTLKQWCARVSTVMGRATQRVIEDHRTAVGRQIQGLYVIVDPEATKGRSVIEVSEAALKGGANVLQLRNKSGASAEFLKTAKMLKMICDDYQRLFICNDDPTVAKLSNASGLHIGQEDLSVADVRQILRCGQLVGRSNNSLHEVLASVQHGVDYVAVGAVFATQTVGKGNRRAIGIVGVEQAKDAVSKPVVAIGGINLENAAEVVRAGADAVSVISAVTMKDDVQSAASKLSDVINNA